MMKVYLSVALAAIFFTGTANAQHSSEKVTIGIKGGLNIYKISGPVDYDAKLGFNAGLLAHFHLASHVALQPEVVYSAQGAKGVGAASNYKYNLGYVNVPVLVQYMFDNGFRIEAGPQVGFLATGKQKIGNAPSTDIKNNFRNTDFALVGGISYVHPSTGFGVDLRYVHGITNIIDNNIADNNTAKSTNRGGQLGIFYLINHRH